MNDIEAGLAKLIQNGDQKAFEILFKTWYPRLCAYAFNYTHQWETAEDIVKDFFLALWNSRTNFEVKTSLGGYLLCSVKNLCINYIQRDKNRKFSLLAVDVNQLEFDCNEPFTDDYLNNNLFAHELELRIHAEVEKLPVQCREIFKLSRFEGHSHKKIANLLNISENTVKVQIYRAIKTIKKSIFSIILFIWLFS